MNHLLANKLNLNNIKQLVLVCILLILTATMLSACTEAPSNTNNTYIKRLENITDNNIRVTCAKKTGSARESKRLASQLQKVIKTAI